MRAARVTVGGHGVPCPRHPQEELLVVLDGPQAGKQGCRRCLGRVEVDEERTVDGETGEVLRRVDADAR